METQKQTKQVICIRKDLNMRKGKIASQAGHASLAVLTNLQRPYLIHGGVLAHNLPTVMIEWLNSSFAKICVYVNSEQELLDVYNKAKEKGMLCSLITDNGKTEFNGVPTTTCCAIGPDYNEAFEGITDKLPLY